jgi:hypothetical protein
MFRTKSTTPKPTIGRGRGPTITCTPLPPTPAARRIGDGDTTALTRSVASVAHIYEYEDNCDGTSGDLDDPNDPYAKAKRLAPDGAIWRSENEARPGDRLRKTLRRLTSQGSGGN